MKCAGLVPALGTPLSGSRRAKRRPATIGAVEVKKKESK